MPMTVTEMTKSINLWYVTLWKKEGDHLVKVEPFNYIVALPKSQETGHILAPQFVVGGAMLPEECYSNTATCDLKPDYQVSAEIVEWERPGNIARLFV